MNIPRIEKLIQTAIATFELDLSEFTVLTEAATGYYMFTPIVAGIAGAKQVFALTRDSRYGKAAEVYENTMKIARMWKVDEKIEILFDRNDKRISKADIVTNLGFVRHLDSDFLRKLKKTVVIPLMFETWEYRNEDLDLKECRSLGVPVLGTNEHHDDLKIFEYIGHVALKLLLEVGIEVFRSKIVVLGQGEFAENTAKTLTVAEAQVIFLHTSNSPQTISVELLEFVKHADALVIVDPHSRKQLIGSEEGITAESLASLNRGLTVIHICGRTEISTLREQGIQCWPQYFAAPGYMSVGTDYVGPKPLIKLHTAGLKVGECLAHARKSGLNAFDSELKVLKELEIAQGFEGYH